MTCLLPFQQWLRHCTSGFGPVCETAQEALTTFLAKADERVWAALVTAFTRNPRRFLHRALPLCKLQVQGRNTGKGSMGSAAGCRTLVACAEKTCVTNSFFFFFFFSSCPGRGLYKVPPVGDARCFWSGLKREPTTLCLLPPYA